MSGLSTTELGLASAERGLRDADEARSAALATLAAARKSWLLARGWHDVSTCPSDMHRLWKFMPPPGRAGPPWFLAGLAGAVIRSPTLAVKLEKLHGPKWKAS